MEAAGGGGGGLSIPDRLALLCLGLGGIGTVGALMVLRLAVVQLASVGLPPDGRERLLLGWVAPRGIVSAAVASLFALDLEAAGDPEGGTLKGLVFLTILLTVGLQSSTAPWLAQRLGLSQAAGEDSARRCRTRRCSSRRPSHLMIDTRWTAARGLAGLSLGL